MRTRLPPFFVLSLAVMLLLAATLPRATAQAMQKPQPTQKAANPKDPRHFDATRTGDIIDIGPSWLFQAGDNPAFAAQDFDDSKWPVVTREKSLADQGYHPDTNQVWYRAHVQVPPNSGQLLLGVRAFAGSYEVFVNGARIGGEGSMSGPGEIRISRVILFGVPREAVRSGKLTISIHGVASTVVRTGFGVGRSMGGMNPSTRISVGGPAGMVNAEWSAYILAIFGEWIIIVPVSLAVIVALSLYRVLPEQKEYLVAALCGGFTLLAEGLSLIVVRLRLSQSGVAQGAGVIAAFATFALQYDVVLRLVGVRPGRWIRALQAILMAAGVVIVLNLSGIPPYWTYPVLNYVARLGLNLAVPVYLFLELRRGNRDAPILFAFQIVSSILYTLHDTGPFLYQVHLVRTLYVAPSLQIGRFSFSLTDIALLYFWVTLLVIIVLRTVRTARERAEIAGEIAAARSVQQVLIPDFLPQIPGLTVESAYLPAQEVGGDFFQVLPIPGTGDAFIVVGDVSGKGLKAAMTVSLIVGALRMYAESCTSPAELLAGINRRLHGRHAGFATCLVLKITPAGEVTIANAGHPNPYLDGVETQTDSNLPLGITLDVAYTETHLHIDPTQSFTLVTDGVVEATAAATKELFGFDRTQAISRHAANAIAEAARAFGIGAPQADDITVLTVVRTPITIEAAA
jgi:hypothetical protein